MKIKGIIFGVAAVFAAGFSQNANAAAALWAGGDNENDVNPVYFFANGYADIPAASNAARDACRESFNLCVNQINFDDGGLVDNGAYACYGHYIPGGQTARCVEVGGLNCLSDGSSGTPTVPPLDCARRSAMELCTDDGISPCNELFSVADTGSSSPVIRRFGIRGISRASSGGGGGSSAGAIIGGIAVVGLGVWLYSSSTPDLPDAETSFLPVADYAESNGIRDWSVGGRYDWRKGRMSAYYEGRNSAEGFSYGSVLEYKANFWKAEFSESVRGETADYNFALSADFGRGIWKLSPIYRMHSEFANDEFDTTNSLNLSGEFRYDGWMIRSSAGFRWRNADEFGKNARFGLSATRDF